MPVDLSRRALLRRMTVVPWLPLAGCVAQRAPAVSASKPREARIVAVDHQFEEFRYRTPYQFGGRSVDRVTILNVNCRVRTGDGREAWGFGSMTLGNAWAFPAASQDAGLGAMTALAAELAAVTRDCDDTGHPIDLFRALEPVYLRAAATLSRSRRLSPPIPKLCTLVVTSAFDAAIHDAYGKAFGVSCYETYRPAFMRRDLSVDLGPDFKGEFLDRYVPATPRPRMPVFHSVGASDPLHAGDVRTRIDDGLPNTLEEWIPRDGLLRFKIKLNGGDLAADFDRVVRIDRVVDSRAGRASGDRLEVLARFQRRLSERRVSARISPPRARGHADRLRSHPVHRAADRTRPAEGSRKRDARSGTAPAGGDRRVADRSRQPAACTRDGLHRRCAQGLQGSEPGHADGSRGAEVSECSCACRISPARARR